MSAPRRGKFPAPFVAALGIFLVCATVTQAGGWSIEGALVNLKNWYNTATSSSSPLAGESVGGVVSDSIQGSWVDAGLTWGGKVIKGATSYVQTMWGAGSGDIITGEIGPNTTVMGTMEKVGALDVEGIAGEALVDSAAGAVSAASFYALSKGMASDQAHAIVEGGEIAAQCPNMYNADLLQCGFNLIKTGQLKDASYTTPTGPVAGQPGVNIQTSMLTPAPNCELMNNTLVNNLNPNAPCGLAGQTNYAFLNETRSVNPQTLVITDQYVGGNTEVRTPTGINDPGIPGATSGQPIYSVVNTDPTGKVTSTGYWSAGYGMLTGCAAQATATTCQGPNGPVTLPSGIAGGLGLSATAPATVGSNNNKMTNEAPLEEVPSDLPTTLAQQDPPEGIASSLNPAAPGVGVAQGTTPNGVTTPNNTAPPNPGVGAVANSPPTGSEMAGAGSVPGTNVAQGLPPTAPNTQTPPTTNDSTPPPDADVNAQVTGSGCASTPDPAQCEAALSGMSGSCRHAIQLATAARLDPAPFDCARTSNAVNLNGAFSAVASDLLTSAQVTEGKQQLSQVQGADPKSVELAAANTATSAANKMNTQATVYQTASSMDQAAAARAQQAAKQLNGAVSPATYMIAPSTGAGAQPGMVMINTFDPLAAAALSLVGNGCAAGTAMPQSQAKQCVTGATTYARTAQNEEIAAMRQAGYASAAQTTFGLGALSGAKTAAGGADGDSATLNAMTTNPNGNSPAAPDGDGD